MVDKVIKREDIDLSDSRDATEKEIEKLIRNDYEHYALQLLLAELVYKTQDLHSGKLKARYAGVLKQILGPPKNEKKYYGVKHDEDLLIELAMLIELHKEPLYEAANHIARREKIKGYHFKNKKIPNHFSEEEVQAIDSLKRKLVDNYQRSPEKYSGKWIKMVLSENNFEEIAEKDLKDAKSRISKWLKYFT